MKHVIRESEIKELEFPNINVKELIDSDKPSFSIAKIKLKGVNDKTKNTLSDVYYYILEGSGKFVIDGAEHSVNKGDLVCIPKNSVYQDSGNLLMLSICLPKFNFDKVVVEK